MVSFDFTTNRAVAVPESWRSAIAQYERGPTRIYR